MLKSYSTKDYIEAVMDEGVPRPLAFALYQKGLSVYEAIEEGKPPHRTGVSPRRQMRNMRRWRNKKERGTYHE